MVYLIINIFLSNGRKTESGFFNEMAENIKLKGNIITPFRVIENGEVCYCGDKITYVGKAQNNDSLYTVKDYGNNYISPGFIDIHIHGGGGYDFMLGTEEAFLGAAEFHAKHGTTVLLPTSMCCLDDELFAYFDAFKKVKNVKTNGAQMPGLHLEGPYFSDAQKGAQDPRYILKPTKEHYEKLLEKCPDIIRWSVAAEVEGGYELGRALKERDIVASIGHSNAKLEEALEAYENGYTLLTHFYSGMSALVREKSYRFPGLIESGYMLDAFDVEIIADARHLPASLLKYIYQAKGASRIALITDSTAGAGLAEGTVFKLGTATNGTDAIIEDEVAKLLDRSAFAGSAATTDRLVRNMIKYANAGVVDAVRMMTATPARIMNFKNKGILTAGNDSDIVVFNDNVDIQATIIGGRTVYEK